MEEEDVVGNAARVGGMFKDELEKLREEFPVVSNVRGRGLVLAFDLPDGDSRDEFRGRCWEAGFATLACGDRTVRFRPPLVFTEADVNQAMSTMRTVLS
jgi:L-lysine 6-transaminase